MRRPALASSPPVYTLGAYAGPVRRGLIAYKEDGIRALASPFAAALASAVSALPTLPALIRTPRPPGVALWLVPVPSRRAAARRRGGDHLVRLARGCARLLTARGCPTTVGRALRVESAVADSVGLGAAERLANLSGRLHPRRRCLPAPGVPVLLLDDVITTGATLATASATLVSAGTRVVAALTLAAVP